MAIDTHPHLLAKGVTAGRFDASLAGPARTCSRFLALCATTILSGCTLVTPARFDRVPPRDVGLTSAHTDNAATPLMPLTGQYTATILTHWTGPVRGKLLAEPTRDGFRANTPPGVAWSLIGGIEGSLGPIFVPFIFPRGMILTWTSTVPTTDAPGMGSIGFGTRSSMRLETRIASPGAPVELIMKDGRVVGTMTLNRLSPGEETQTNHLALVDAMDRQLHESLFDPALTDSPDMRGYLKDLRKGAAKVHDDIEFLMVEALAARAFPKLAAGFIYPKPNASDELALGNITNPVTPFQVKQEKGVTTIRFDAIFDERTVDQAFELALGDAPAAIVLDLRKAAGLDVGALRLVSWLSPAPINAGLFVSRADRESILDGADAATISLDSPQAYQSLRAALSSGHSASVQVVPLPNAFKGPVAIITGKRASGSTEAAIAAIQSSLIAPTFGEPTAGKPLVSSEFDLATSDTSTHPWITRIPVAEFLPLGRQSIMDNGVRPDVAAKGDSLNETVSRWLDARLAQHTWDAPDWFETPLKN